MIFSNSIKAWKTDAFQHVVKQDIEQQNSLTDVLQKGLSQGSHVADDPVNAVIIASSEVEDSIHVKAGVFYRSVIAGCSCADDPTPVDTNQEYCELEFVIDKSSGETVVELIEDL